MNVPNVTVWLVPGVARLFTAVWTIEVDPAVPEISVPDTSRIDQYASVVVLIVPVTAPDPGDEPVFALNRLNQELAPSNLVATNCQVKPKPDTLNI